MKRTVIKLLAFTLSELLVTLSIVGVVSALTVPTMINKYQAQANVTQLRKVYFDLSQAIDLLLTDEGKNSISATSLKDDPGIFLKKYLRINQDCGSNLTPCFANSYKNINSGSSVNLVCNGKGKTVLTTAGYAVCIYNLNNVPDVLVDINGPEKPNIAGRDLFTFSIYSDGSLDENMSPLDKINMSADDMKQRRNDMAAKCLSTDYNAIGCFSKILNANWKMDY